MMMFTTQIHLLNSRYRLNLGKKVMRKMFEQRNLQLHHQIFFFLKKLENTTHQDAINERTSLNGRNHDKFIDMGKSNSEIFKTEFEEPESVFNKT